MNKLNYKILRQNLNFTFQPGYFWKQISLDLALLLTMYGLFQTPFAVINSFLIPVFMFRQFSILHEAVHGLTHPNSKINHALGVVAGVFCLTPFTAWKVAHMKHHYWTGNLEQDPTFAILKTFPQFHPLKKKLIEICWRQGVPLIGALQHYGFWLFGFKSRPTFEGLLSLTLPLVFYTSLAYAMSSINLAISVVGIIIYFRMYEDMIIPQHVGLYSDDDSDLHPHAWDQPEVTRSWYLPSALERYVVLNMNYHTEHHLFPDLPWHELGEAHKMLLQKKENLLIVESSDWMKAQRLRLFGQVIIPVPSRKTEAA